MEIYSRDIGVCCQAEAAKTEALQHHPRQGYKYAPNAQWQILMAVKAFFSSSVKMTQKSCFLMVAEPGFGPSSGQ